MIGEFTKNFTSGKSKQTVQARYVEWLRQAMMNYVPMTNDLEEGLALDLGKTPMVLKDTPCLVISSGPGLDMHGSRLKEVVDRYPDLVVFCPTSQAQTFTYYAGKRPDYIVAVDAGEVTWKEAAWLDKDGNEHAGPFGDGWAGTTLMTTITAHPRLYHYWRNNKWPIKLFQQYQPEIDLFDHVFPSVFPLTLVSMAGCVTNAMIQIANRIGYTQFHIGMDYGYPYGMERCTEWKHDGDDWYKIEPGRFTVQRHALRKAANGVRTDSVMLMYKQAFMNLLHEDMFDITHIGPYDGIVYEVATMEMNDFLDDWQTYPRLTDEEKTAITEEWQTKAGLRKIEAEKKE